MIIKPDCVPCFERQIKSTVCLSTNDPLLRRRAEQEALRLVKDSPADIPPPVLAREVYRTIGKWTGNRDPYRLEKEKHNRAALEAYDKIKVLIHAGPDPLEKAMRLAVAGNDIDFAACHEPQAIKRIVGSVDSIRFHIDHGEHLFRDLKRFDRILYLLDNAGEIVFDKLFIEMILQSRAGNQPDLIAVVRGMPVINDATMEDARLIGLDRVVQVIDNGDDTPGTSLAHVSSEMKGCFERSGMVISKGQGNYETLGEEKRLIYFLMKVKCPAVAADFGAARGEFVLLRSGGDGRKSGL